MARLLHWLPLVSALAALGVSMWGLATKAQIQEELQPVRERVIVLETQRTEELRRLESIEAKVDRLLERKP